MINIILKSNLYIYVFLVFLIIFHEIFVFTGYITRYIIYYHQNALMKKGKGNNIFGFNIITYIFFKAFLLYFIKNISIF